MDTFISAPEWEDVQPIAQADSSHPAVATTQAEETLGYFRAVRAAKELSSRALDVTQAVSGHCCF